MIYSRSVHTQNRILLINIVLGLHEILINKHFHSFVHFANEWIYDVTTTSKVEYWRNNSGIYESILAIY